MTDDEFWEGWKGFTLPKINAVWPTLAASQIVSVQSMVSPGPYCEPFKEVEKDILDDIIKEIMNNFNRITEALLYETN
jgi:hypothetical protein